MGRRSGLRPQRRCPNAGDLGPAWRGSSAGTTSVDLGTQNGLRRQSSTTVRARSGQLAAPRRALASSSAGIGVVRAELHQAVALVVGVVHLGRQRVAAAVADARVGVEHDLHAAPLAHAGRELDRQLLDLPDARRVVQLGVRRARRSRAGGGGAPRARCAARSGRGASRGSGGRRRRRRGDGCARGRSRRSRPRSPNSSGSVSAAPIITITVSPGSIFTPCISYGCFTTRSTCMTGVCSRISSSMAAGTTRRVGDELVAQRRRRGRGGRSRSRAWR